MIDNCPNCKPHSQDELHGKNRRVFNAVSLKSGGVELRCTVCGTKRFMHGAVAQEAKKSKKAKDKKAVAV